MSAYASYAGSRIVRGSVSIPLYGGWSGDFDLATSDSVPDTGVLSIGNLSLQSFAFRRSAFGGQRKLRIGAGFGGWRKIVESRTYHLPIGIPLALVLGDVALEVGEKLNAGDLLLAALKRPLGGYYLRDADPAAHVLRRLAGPLWWIDADGTTRVASSRPSDLITSPFIVSNFTGGEGRITVATEDLASWVPGRTFTSDLLETTMRIQAVTHTATAGGELRTEALVVNADTDAIDNEPGVPTLDDRVLYALRQIIAYELPRGFYNDDSACIIDGGTGVDEHVLTTEALINVLTSLLQLLPFTVPILAPAADGFVAGALANAQDVDLSTDTPLSLLAIEAVMAAKRQRGQSPNQPGIGCPEVRSG